MCPFDLSQSPPQSALFSHSAAFPPPLAAWHVLRPSTSALQHVVLATTPPVHPVWLGALGVAALLSLQCTLWGHPQMRGLPGSRSHQLAAASTLCFSHEPRHFPPWGQVLRCKRRNGVMKGVDHAAKGVSCGTKWVNRATKHGNCFMKHVTVCHVDATKHGNCFIKRVTICHVANVLGLQLHMIPNSGEHDWQQTPSPFLHPL